MSILQEETVRDYFDPVFISIVNNLVDLENRRIRRPVSEWGASDFQMTSSAAKQLAEDCQWILDAIEIIRDVRAGAFDAEDREGGTPG